MARLCVHAAIREFWTRILADALTGCRLSDGLIRRGNLMWDRLNPNEYLGRGDLIESPNARFRLKLETTGELTFSDDMTRSTPWRSGVTDPHPLRAEMRSSDGVLVCLNTTGGEYWKSATSGNPMAYVMVTNAGRAAIYTAQGGEIIGVP